MDLLEELIELLSSLLSWIGRSPACDKRPQTATPSDDSCSDVRGCLLAHLDKLLGVLASEDLVSNSLRLSTETLQRLVRFGIAPDTRFWAHEVEDPNRVTAW